MSVPDLGYWVLFMFAPFAFQRTFVRGFFTLGLLLAASAVQSAPVTYTFDFTATPDSVSGAGAGNELVFLDTVDGTKSATVTSWASILGAGLSQETGYQITGAINEGIAVCNSSENKCLTSDNKRGITQNSGDDWVLVTFSERMNLSEFVISPDLAKANKSVWADVTYYVGDTASPTDVLGQLPDDLGWQRFDYNSGAKTTSDVTLNINGANGGAEVWGNSILIGGLDDTIGGGADRILLNTMSTVVPIPAAVWLFLSALGVIFIRPSRTKRK